METIAATAALRIACDGPSRVQTLTPYTRDTGAANGTATLTEWTGTVTLGAIANPPPEALYRGGWQSNNVGNPIGYVLTDLTPGTQYQVRVHFCAEAGSAGKYTFSLEFIGTTTQTVTSLDPEDDPGIAVAKVVERTVTANDSGNITIRVIPAGGGQSAQMCGFDILPVGPTPQTIASRPTPSAPTAASIPALPTPGAPAAASITARPTPSAPSAASIPSLPTPTAPTPILT